MRFVLFLFVLSMTEAVHAAELVEVSMYTPKAVAVGRGKTIEEARTAAFSVLANPPGGRTYVLDPTNSPLAQCTGGVVPDVKLETCEGAEWQLIIPLIEKKG